MQLLRFSRQYNNELMMRISNIKFDLACEYKFQ